MIIANERQAIKKTTGRMRLVLDRISGSHHIMIKDHCRSIPIPVHGTTDLPRGLVRAILKQAGIKEK
jgi:predicted RNA binding protein YcfA (HicA-like mRNA interferase family)